ncbi:MAG: glutamyl-tRNA reductase, partial [Burkholderiales bacterium]|nr:glutamyl-tRNA reductase [Burkholderiales bacterium]
TQALEFLRWLEGRSVVPTINALQSHHETLRQKELERARRLLANGTPPEEVMEALTRGLVNKCLHAPLQTLNRAADDERTDLAALYQRIYQLPEQDS